jgi:hypothetical protein
LWPSNVAGRPSNDCEVGCTRWTVWSSPYHAGEYDHPSLQRDSIERVLDRASRDRSAGWIDLAAVVVISIETGRTWLGLGFSFADVSMFRCFDDDEMIHDGLTRWAPVRTELAPRSLSYHRGDDGFVGANAVRCRSLCHEFDRFTPRNTFGSTIASSLRFAPMHDETQRRRALRPHQTNPSF